MRRDSSDLKWKETKNIVYERDKNSCRLVKILNIIEFLKLQKNAGSYLKTIDPAHVISVSENPSLCYESNNIVCLNRYSHTMLDSYKDPIDGHALSSKEHNDWWIRILKGNTEQYNYLLENHIIGE